MQVKQMNNKKSNHYFIFTTSSLKKKKKLIGKFYLDVRVDKIEIEKYFRIFILKDLFWSSGVLNKIFRWGKFLISVQEHHQNHDLKLP